MASAKQILANKKNARRSTGPKTKLGKEKVSMNAMKLGIYAEHHVMVGEDTEQHKKLHVILCLKPLRFLMQSVGL